MAYAKVGLTPDGGAVRALLQRLPPALVFELLADASPISAERLHSLGCVNRLSPPGEAAAVALQWAERLANGPRTVQARLKKAVNDAPQTSLSQALDQERDHFVQSLHEADAREGIEAFLAKRQARFGGTIPS
jgi:enoyl-CoA hydratase/carnithine racemase